MSEENELSLGSWHFDALTRFLIADENCRNLFGYTEFDGTVDAFLRCLHSSDQRNVTDAIARTLQTGAHFDVTYNIALPDGADRKIRSVGSPLRDESGKVVEVSGICEAID